MKFIHARHTFLLFFGDLVILAFSLYIALLLRHLEAPSVEFLFSHIPPFAILLVVWLIVFYIAGLYETNILLFRRRLPSLLMKTQGANILIAVLFFYLIPFFGITPKTNLAIYLVVSVTLILLWRLYYYELFSARAPRSAALIGHGPEMRELKEVVNGNIHLGVRFSVTADLDELTNREDYRKLARRIEEGEVTLAVVDFQHAKSKEMVSELYNLVFSRIAFFDFSALYMDTFGRAPISSFYYSWFVEHHSNQPRIIYDVFKRLMDITIALILGTLSLVLYPFVFLAIKLDDGGSIFITQERVGKYKRPIHITKFRTMKTDDGGDREKGKSNGITRVGNILRKSRIDELPQLWSVVKGDLSLIGPRPEVRKFVERYEAEIPYYHIRHSITPGLSGWAQLYHTDPPREADIGKAKQKLSYDIYYIINRSLLLDIAIALKTIRALVARTGS